MVVNSCTDAKRIDQEHNLSSYNNTYDCADDAAWADKKQFLQFRSKIMTQDVNDPDYFHQHKDTDELFVNRISTYIDTKIG